jgi:hypothetical protein
MIRNGELERKRDGDRKRESEMTKKRWRGRKWGDRDTAR